MRAPTDMEKEQLAYALEVYDGGDEAVAYNFEEYKEAVDSSYVCIFEDYITEGSGYEGKVGVLVSDGSSGMFQCFIWKDGRAIVQEQEYCRECEKLQGEVDALQEKVKDFE